MTLREAAESISTAEGWMRLNKYRIYRNSDGNYCDEHNDHIDTLDDDVEVVDLGNDCFATA